MEVFMTFRKLAVVFLALTVAGAAFAKDNLAILPFTGGTAEEGETIAELFSFSDELNAAFTLIPRTSITGAIGSEWKFQTDTGMTDPDSIMAIGRQLGANYVVAGNIAKLGTLNLLVISILKIDDLRQVAGDVQTYTRIGDIRSKLPDMARNMVEAARIDATRLDKLAVTPVQVRGDVDARVADTLAQVLSANLIKSGKYAVYPRTVTLEQVQKEYDNQTSGITANENVVGIGRGENPRLVLSVAARRLDEQNMFNAAIINLESGAQAVGRSVDYQSLDDGVMVMEELAFALGGKRKTWTVSDTAGFAQAVAAINAETNARAYTITLGGSFSSDPIRFTSNAAKTITLKGDNSVRTISNNGGDALFTVPLGVTLVLDSNLTLNGNGKEARVVFVKGGALIMKEGSTIYGSQDGGVYVVEEGAFTLEGGEIRDNKASSSYGDTYGGGVHVNSGSFIMSGGIISGNAVSSSSFSVFGGGVFVWESAFTMSGGAIRGNTASGSGSYSDGGGVYVTGNSIFTMSGGTISGNAVEGGGGGVHIWSSAFRMSGGSISNNRASSSDSCGGGVFVSSNSTFTMSGGTISNNTTHDGGGVYVYGENSAFRMARGTITSNTSDYGGGVYVLSNNSAFGMSGGTIRSNTASREGGGVYVSGRNGSGTFIKSGDSVIDDTNRANLGKVAFAAFGAKRRNTSAGPGVNLDNTKSGSEGGWE
jgi:hypothetical protein